MRLRKLRVPLVLECRRQTRAVLRVIPLTTHSSLLFAQLCVNFIESGRLAARHRTFPIISFLFSSYRCFLLFDDCINFADSRDNAFCKFFLGVHAMEPFVNESCWLLLKYGDGLIEVGTSNLIVFFVRGTCAERILVRCFWHHSNLKRLLCIVHVAVSQIQVGNWRCLGAKIVSLKFFRSFEVNNGLYYSQSLNTKRTTVRFYCFLAHFIL